MNTLIDVAREWAWCSVPARHRHERFVWFCNITKGKDYRAQLIKAAIRMLFDDDGPSVTWWIEHGHACRLLGLAWVFASFSYILEHSVNGNAWRSLHETVIHLITNTPFDQLE